MWSDYLSENRFLVSLYDEMPTLKNVQITQFRNSCSGNRVELVFDMPIYAQNPPKKWEEYKCNAVIVEIDFAALKTLDFKLNCTNYIGDIDIFLDENELVNLRIKGDIDVSLSAEYAFIQKVEGYCLSETEQ